MMRGAWFSARIGSAVAVLFLLAGGGCGKEEAPSPPMVKKAVPQEAARAEAPPAVAAVAAAPPAVALYDPAGKRDPFVPFLRVEKREARTAAGSLPPLQRMELGELRFVGVIWSPNVTRALVEDSEGKGYTVKVGTRIGREGGVVTRITETEIFVKEEFRDYTGAKVERINSLKLKIPGGE